MESSDIENDVPFPSDCLLGLLVTLSPGVRFSEEQLRAFFLEESRSHPSFGVFFRPRKTECGDKTDGLADLLFRFGILRDEARNGFSVRHRIGESYKEALREGNILPRHERFFQELADRFERMLEKTRQPEQKAQAAQT